MRQDLPRAKSVSSIRGRRRSSGIRCTAEMANRVPSLLGSSCWPMKLEPCCAHRSDDTEALWSEASDVSPSGGSWTSRQQPGSVARIGAANPGSLADGPTGERPPDASSGVGRAGPRPNGPARKASPGTTAPARKRPLEKAGVGSPSTPHRPGPRPATRSPHEMRGIGRNEDSTRLGGDLRQESPSPGTPSRAVVGGGSRHRSDPFQALGALGSPRGT